MKCDKNYFHVTPEHLTPDRLAQRSTGDQTAGTACCAAQDCGWMIPDTQEEQEALKTTNTDTLRPR